MANVTLSIGGHHYTLACDDSEAARLEQLGRMVDDQISAVRAETGPLTEALQLLLAAIHLAERVDNAAHSAAAPAPQPETCAGGDLASLANRIDGVTGRLRALVGETG